MKNANMEFEERERRLYRALSEAIPEIWLGDRSGKLLLKAGHDEECIVRYKRAEIRFSENIASVGVHIAQHRSRVNPSYSERFEDGIDVTHHYFYKLSLHSERESASVHRIIEKYNDFHVVNAIGPRFHKWWEAEVDMQFLIGWFETYKYCESNLPPIQKL